MKKSIAIAAVLGCAGAAQAQNLVQNPSFETPGPGFVLWEHWENYGNVFEDASVEVAAQDGLVSAKMFGQFSGSQNDQVLLQTVTGITAGQQYTLGAYTLHNVGDEVAAGNLILLQLNFQNANGDGLESQEVEAIVPGVTPAGEWHLSEVSGIAPPGTTQVLIALLHLQLDGAAGGASFWDNVSLTEGDAPCSNPADFNHDGVLDFFDVQAFLNAFSQGC
jgi:hypothetical protein